MRKSANIFSKADRMGREETEEILENVNLVDKRFKRADTMSYGDQKRVEIGIALASKPEILLLDEPTAGMSPEETASTTHLIQRLAQEQGLTIVFIEHDMNVVFGISDKIRVMNQGKIIAEGKPEEVRADTEVQRVYLEDKK
jgi:branched-chain amino acid transport system ATP-binding protein